MSFVIIVFLSVLLTCSFSCAPNSTNLKLVYSSPEISERVMDLREKLQNSPDDVDAHIELGWIFLKEDYLIQAKAQFEYVINQNPKIVEAYLLLSFVFQRQRKPDWEQAITILNKAKNISPNYADIYLNLAQVYQELGQDENATANFINAIELSNDSTTILSARLGLMSIYQKTGEIDKANNELIAARRIYPGIDDILKKVEIEQLTPSPRYAGDEFTPADGIHPDLETRIKLIQKEIKKLSEKK